MPSTRTCDFSGEDIEPGTGIMYVRNDGTVLHFKDRKAEKNYFMGREARDLEWTEAGWAATEGRRSQQVEQEPAVEDEPAEQEPAGTPDLESAEAEGDADEAEPEGEGAEAEEEVEATEGEEEVEEPEAENEEDDEE
jgi:large subunit ribosomal protein L24e